MALEAGTKLGPYEILSPLGAGGMGEVYLAKDTTLERQVAIKVLPPEVASRPQRLQRFEQEAKTVAAINHPNIVTIHGIHHENACRYIAMELVEGTSLDRLIGDGGLPLGRIFDIAIPLADALAAAHDKNIVHRDLKPANVMVTKDGRVKVLDFGLAKLMAGGEHGASPNDETISAPLTGQGMVIGTVPYMSPEQLQGDPLDHRTDLFSFGIMLYEMATGQRPFTGKSSMAISSAILRDTPRPLHELNSAMPRHLGRIIEHCLEKDAEHRYQSAKDVRNELRALRKEMESGSGLSEPVPMPVPTVAGPSSTPPSTTAGSTLSAPAKRGELWMAVAVLAVAILGASWWLGRRDGESKPTPIHAPSRTATGTSVVPGETVDSNKQDAVSPTLAILPFDDHSPTRQPWLASGMADRISAQLGRVSTKKLGVIGPETTSYYARRDRPIQNLREDLDVVFVLGGSIHNIDRDVRITVKLIRAADGISAWSDEFRGTLDDWFALQSMVAERIIAGLPIELTGEEQTRLKSPYVPDPNAQIAYLQGRHSAPWDAGVQNLEKAIEYFEEAIKLDPQYALPYCGLVDAKCFLTTWGRLQTRHIRNEMEATIKKALDFDDTLPDVHVSAGVVAEFVNWDWSRAEASFERAILLDPNHARAYLESGHLMLVLGRFDEAEQRFERAIQLNPKRSEHHAALGKLYVGTGELAKAEPLLEKAFKLNNGSSDANVWLADLRQKQRRFDQAVEIMERVVNSKEKPELAMRAFLGNAYAMARRLDDARTQLAEMQQSQLPGHHMWFGELHAALGETDEAFRRLNQALEEREAWLPHIRLDPGLIHIRSDPRFAELHRKMGLEHVDLSYAQGAP